MLDVTEQPVLVSTESPNGIHGRLMTPELFIPQAVSSKDLGKRLQTFDPALLESRGLGVLKETPQEMWHRVNCLPTATMVSINTLTGKPIFGAQEAGKLSLFDVYTAGVLAHVNDKKGEEPKKGYPSFHYKNGEMYHPFVVGLARRFGLDGMVVTNFPDAEFVPEVVKQGGIAILSLDNYFIRDVSAKHAQIQTLSTAKHAEIFHAVKDEDRHLLFSDVFNQRDGKEWNSLNLETESAVVGNYLTCPRNNDNSSRAIILYNPLQTPSQKIREALPKNGTVIEVPQHPILSYKPELGLQDWNAEIEGKWQNQGLAQWDLVEDIKT